MSIVELYPTFRFLTDEIQTKLYDFYYHNRNAYQIMEDHWKDDEEEKYAIHWHAKHYRIEVLFNTWKYIRTLDDKSKTTILNSTFMKLGGVGSINYTTFSRYINYNDIEMIQYYYHVINDNFAKKYNKTYQENITDKF